MKIIAKHNWRPFRYRYDVPKKILREDFDWLGEDTDYGFFRYRGCWYHLSQFMRIDSNSSLATLVFDGYLGDSYFSGVLIKLSDDCEEFQVATYIS